MISDSVRKNRKIKVIFLGGQVYGGHESTGGIFFEHMKRKKYMPGDSSRDLLIPQLEVTIRPLNGQINHPKKVTIAELPGG